MLKFGTPHTDLGSMRRDISGPEFPRAGMTPEEMRDAGSRILCPPGCEDMALSAVFFGDGAASVGGFGHWPELGDDEQCADVWINGQYATLRISQARAFASSLLDSLSTAIESDPEAALRSWTQEEE
jgi:hypothetical protein